ncbi:uncharacterized protein LOC107366378 [Tetranychus urticae]|uniref:Uncharacterized protein n=1 Tax=Tetranychus urticae TaxID=32264 RepID=T1KR00_TETUR|nr:uncharacterized protein LOC107366378 [Tetranychus urticae]XP_025017501.1 uncharacterized protein LOC107366378 [Tetranychus urticae]
MAQSYLPTYQIVLFVVLGINVIFWIILLCWRFFCFDTMANNLTRCRRFLNSLTSLSINVNQMHNFTIRGAVLRINSDLPPPYEQAIKYPSLTSISGQLTGHCNQVLIAEHANCCSSQLEPAPSYFESQVLSLPLHQPHTAPSSSSSSSSSSSVSSSCSTKPIKGRSIHRSFSFGDMESYKKFHHYLNNV